MCSYAAVFCLPKCLSSSKENPVNGIDFEVSKALTGDIFRRSVLFSMRRRKISFEHSADFRLHVALMFEGKI